MIYNLKKTKNNLLNICKIDMIQRTSNLKQQHNDNNL